MTDDARLVTIVGAGLAGAACAVALTRAGVPVRLVDRGRSPGGRMCSPRIRGRAVDLGAGYLTAKDEDFAALVARWRRIGLARPWTDTFSVLRPEGAAESKTGPMRWGTPGGLGSLVRAMLDEARVRVESGVDVADPGALTRLRDGGPVVLAMPDPQAARLLATSEVDGWDPVEYEPVIAVACGYRERVWSALRGAGFVNDHPDVAFVADDGSRRGDGAPVLVAHTSAAFARRHLDDPVAAIGPVAAALTELLGVGAPTWTHAHRWTFAKPATAHDRPFLLTDLADDGGAPAPVGLAGDQWCPDGSPRVESAWLSGTRLARALVDRASG